MLFDLSDVSYLITKFLSFYAYIPEVKSYDAYPVKIIGLFV
jgi:hypothetical protein